MANNEMDEIIKRLEEAELRIRQLEQMLGIYRAEIRQPAKSEVR